MTDTLPPLTESQRIRFLTVHKSDAAHCMRKLRAKLIDGIDSDNAPRRIGSACARAAEALAYEDEGAKTPAEMFAVAKDAIIACAGELAMQPEEIAEACDIMAKALAPDSMLRFGRPTGWESAAEWRWALDRNFRPVPFGDPKAICAGIIDLALWHENDGKASATDDKATKSFQSAEDCDDFEGWLYSLAMIETFGVRSAWFYYRNLRAGYRVGLEFRRGDPWHETVKAVVLARRAEREVAVELNEFPETMGPDCKWCPVKHKCGAQLAAARDGRVIPPDLPPADIVRRMMAYKAMLADYEDAAKSIVKETDAPIDIGSGVVYGLKPVGGWRLRSRFTGPDGRDRLMNFLRNYKMTPAQEKEWFGFVKDSGLATATRIAIYELLGKEAKRFLDDVDVSPIEEETNFENSAWMPATGKRAPKKTVDELIEETRW